MGDMITYHKGCVSGTYKGYLDMNHFEHNSRARVHHLVQMEYIKEVKEMCKLQNSHQKHL